MPLGSPLQLRLLQPPRYPQTIVASPQLPEFLSLDPRGSPYLGPLDLPWLLCLLCHHPPLPCSLDTSSLPVCLGLSYISRALTVCPASRGPFFPPNHFLDAVAPGLATTPTALLLSIVPPGLYLLWATPLSADP